MKTAALTFGCLLLVTTAVGQHQETAPARGSIYGVVIGNDGQPAKRIGLTAMPLGVALGMGLPHTTTNDKGEYRFDLHRWGKYTVYAEDEDAGYSSYSTGHYDQGQPLAVEITDEHREAQMTITLPPRAAFLKVNLTNRNSGTPIPAMHITVLSDTDSFLGFDMSCSSTHVILLAPDRDLLIHISSDGFREWDESLGGGRMLHLGSGEHLELDVALDPAQRSSGDSSGDNLR
jgi:hypothetical protein